MSNWPKHRMDLNRVNRARGPTKENRQNFCMFPMFLTYAKKYVKWNEMGPGLFFPTNPDLADILGRTDLNFEISFFFFICWTPNLWISGPQISKFLDFQVPRSPNSQISEFPDFQVPRFPDAAAGAAAGRILRSQPDPSPNAPRDQIRRKALAATCHA